MYRHFLDDFNLPVENREVHNLYGAIVHKTTYEALIERVPDHNDRPFVLSRSFFAGSQKYGPVWTGDTQASLEDLKVSIQMLLSLSIAGIGQVGADIGGFSGVPNAALLQKWHAIGAFYPFARQHCHHTAPRREPYAVDDEMAKRIIRHSLKFR